MDRFRGGECDFMKSLRQYPCIKVVRTIAGGGRGGGAGVGVGKGTVQGIPVSGAQDFGAKGILINLPRFNVASQEKKRYYVGAFSAGRTGYVLC